MAAHHSVKATELGCQSLIGGVWLSFSNCCNLCLIVFGCSVWLDDRPLQVSGQDGIAVLIDPATDGAVVDVDAIGALQLFGDSFAAGLGIFLQDRSDFSDVVE